MTRLLAILSIHIRLGGFSAALQNILLLLSGFGRPIVVLVPLTARLVRRQKVRTRRVVRLGFKRLGIFTPAADDGLVDAARGVLVEVRGFVFGTAVAVVGVAAEEAVFFFLSGLALRSFIPFVSEG